MTWAHVKKWSVLRAPRCRQVTRRSSIAQISIQINETIGLTSLSRHVKRVFVSNHCGDSSFEFGVSLFFAEQLHIFQCNVDPVNIYALWFDIPPARCASRLCHRSDHPSLSSANVELAHRVLKFFLTALVPPSVEEGFAHVRVVRSNEDVDQAIEFFAQLVLNQSNSSADVDHDEE
jgi:hypothetical protein